MEKKNIVDIIPIPTPTGDYMKIKDSDPVNVNNKVNSFLNLLEIVAGKSAIYPTMGDYITLNRIPFSDVDVIVGELTERVTDFLDFPVEIDYEERGINKSNILLKAKISGLPGLITFNASNNNGFVKLLNPKYIKDDTYGR